MKLYILLVLILVPAIYCDVMPEPAKKSDEVTVDKGEVSTKRELSTKSRIKQLAMIKESLEAKRERLGKRSDTLSDEETHKTSGDIQDLYVEERLELVNRELEALMSEAPAKREMTVVRHGNDQGNTNSNNNNNKNRNNEPNRKGSGTSGDGADILD